MITLTKLVERLYGTPFGNTPIVLYKDIEKSLDVGVAMQPFEYDGKLMVSTYYPSSDLIPFKEYRAEFCRLTHVKTGPHPSAIVTSLECLIFHEGNNIKLRLLIKDYNKVWALTDLTKARHTTWY